MNFFYSKIIFSGHTIYLGLSMTSKNCYLFVTWSPNPKRFKHHLTPKAQYNLTEDLIDYLKYCGDLLVCSPELTTAGNLHWHFIIDVKNKYRWFSKLLPRMKDDSNVLIVKVKNYMKCEEYILKDAEEYSKIFKTTLPIKCKYVPTIPKKRKGIEGTVEEFIEIIEDEA